MIEGITLHGGDCRDILPTLEESSIDSCVTDPPYGLSFMGRGWDHGVPGVEFWREVYRVLKPGAHLVAFGGTRTYHRIVCAIEDAGFEIRDRIRFDQSFEKKFGSLLDSLNGEQRGMLFELLNDYCDGGSELAWEYGQGFPKSHDVSKAIDRAAGELEARGKGFNTAGQNVGLNQNRELRSDHPNYQPYEPATDAAREWQGWGTALKPAFEPIVLARKPLSEKTVAANVLRWRTGALNIDGCRIAGETPVFSYSGGKSAGVFGDGLQGSARTGDVSTAGRWPANVCHDGSDEVVAAFPSNSARFFFNASDELCTQNNASDAELRFPQANELVGSVLKGAVEQSTPQLVLKSIDFPAPFTSVTPSELKQTSARLIEMIQSFAKRCSRESLPAKLTLSDSLVSIAAVCERIDTITITISLSKSNGSVAPVTFNITLTNSEVGAKDSAPSSARFHYSAKASKADRAGSKHPTVKPVSLMQWLARLITPPGGTVLDPFAGSGTTGAACRLDGFRAVLIEREAEYQQDIRNRFAGLPEAAE